MAINYTVLFTDVGQIIKGANEIVLQALPASFGGIPSYHKILSDIKANFQTPESVTEVIQNIDAQFTTLRNQASSTSSTLGARADARFSHKETVIDELDKGNLGIQDLFLELFRDFGLAGESLAARDCRVGDPGTTPHGANVSPATGSIGNGTLSGSLVLDGVTAPSTGWTVNPLYNPQNYPTSTRLSELVTHKERVVFTCTSDEASGTPEGQEIFRGVTDDAGSNEYDWRAYNLDRNSGADALGNPGSGGSATLTTVQAGTALANMGFESFFNTNEPESWTILTGVPGTNIIAETAAANVHIGQSSLRLVTAAELVQSILPGTLIANKRYLFGFWWKADSVTAGQLTLQFESPSGTWSPPVTSAVAPPVNGVNATEGGVVPIDLTGVGTTGWAWAEGWINMPPVIPTDLRIKLTLTGANGNLYIDSMGLGPVTYLGGVGYAITANTTPFLRGDRLILTNAVNLDTTQGVIQKYLSRRYHQQMPSSGTPTIPDSLAT